MNVKIPLRHRIIRDGCRPITQDEWDNTHADFKGSGVKTQKRMCGTDFEHGTVSYPVVIVGDKSLIRDIRESGQPSIKERIETNLRERMQLLGQIDANDKEATKLEREMSAAILEESLAEHREYTRRKATK